MGNFRNILTTLLLCLSPALHAQVINGTWHGLLDTGMGKLNIVFNVDPNNCTLDSPDQGARGIKATLNHASADSLSISVPMLGASYCGKRKGNRLEGTFRQNGHALPLALEEGQLKRNRPQTPRPPLPYTTEETRFINPEDSAVLAGTLTYPTNFDAMRPCPVVLMVTGSGLQNRDEEMMDHRPFAVLADYLARHGIATLRYDDRSTGQSTGDASMAATPVFMQDAAAGLQFLRSKGCFGPIGVLGHSEGGTIALMLAAHKQPDFIITLGAPGLRGDSILLLQQLSLLPPNAQQPAPDIQQVRLSAKAQGNAWLNYFVDYDPAADISEVECPALLLAGSKDIQVHAAPNLAAIRRNMPKDTPLTIKEYDGLNHLMQHCTTGRPDEYANIEETMAEEVMADIAEWLNKMPLK